ncbi:sulfotransferase domain protein [Bacteriovorax sp. BSW11_IV]|uniref:sulfotransferase domain-containing protein n=1 Tax=Bacteriovorax sp. BSW11_IV TaxID=1353529 RepID=UPI00038A4734|nr:sulfotransferase domain-containing protein [Bacteriovorax sp. BSW11_IV]EQC45955.1 sulfotransferase domain protein [Bacteriovorax sp. BSW11_IV]
MEEKQFIDVSGVGSSGKSAVVDILREFEGIFVPANSFEFDLVRAPGGVLDLYHALCEDWSPVRSHNAVRRFQKLVNLVGRSESSLNLWAAAQSTGNRYDSVFHGQFTKLANEFLDSFIKGSYKAYWPYDSYEMAAPQRFFNKFYRKFDFHKKVCSEVLLCDGENFANEFSKFMNALFNQICKDSNKVVLNNAFEAFNPARSLNLLKSAKSIIVTRDPRDIYVSGLSSFNVSESDKALQAVENDGINKSFLATDNLNNFITRYKLYMDHLTKNQDDRVLILKFEDLVENYDESLKKIISHLGLKDSDHVRKGMCFDPSKSGQNIGKWKLFSDQKTVSIISEHLC